MSEVGWAVAAVNRGGQAPLGGPPPLSRHAARIFHFTKTSQKSEVMCGKS